MPKKLAPLAIAYDFDGTLAPGNMQEFDFVPKIGMKPKEFWDEVSQKAREIEADNILVYMRLMLERAGAARVAVHRVDFEDFGKKVELFAGVQEWFDRIDKYGKANGVLVEHFIVSSGIREMIEGTPIAKKFKKIYASGFWCDHNGVACWPAMVLNYTTKTQFLFRINKGALDVWDHSLVNKYVPPDLRPIPFTNMVFVGDGETDVPCFRLVKEQGEHAIAVYKPRAAAGKKRARQLIEDGRVNFSAPADYSPNSLLEKIMLRIIDKTASEHELASLRTEK